PGVSDPPPPGPAPAPLPPGPAPAPLPPGPLRVQSVLYRTGFAEVVRLVSGIAAAAARARAEGLAGEVVVALGDSTPTPCLDDAEVDQLVALAGAGGLTGLRYDPFGANLGHGGGHNRLRSGAPGSGAARAGRARRGEVLVLVNPDAYPAPSALSHLLAALAAPGVAVAEARQVPADNPKLFDRDSGATAWAAACCIAIPLEAFDRVGGFDPSFFMHGDDVDLSWRLRLAGGEVRYVPAAVVFHDRRIEASGYASSPPSAAHHIWLAHLVRTEKAGRSAEATSMAEAMAGSGEPWQVSAAADLGRLRDRRDPALTPYPPAAEVYLALSELRQF
ncbi:MAG: glycosyltransferase family 2 protein, partial [Acidimicrobiales bacterium]